MSVQQPINLCSVCVFYRNSVCVADPIKNWCLNALYNQIITLKEEHAAEVARLTGERDEAREMYWNERDMRIKAEAERDAAVARAERAKGYLEKLKALRDQYYNNIPAASEKVGRDVAESPGYWKGALDIMQYYATEALWPLHAAVARAERAEEVVRVTGSLKFVRESEKNDWHFCITKEELAELRKALAAAQDAKPDYRALEPEPWGGPEGETV